MLIYCPVDADSLQYATFTFHGDRHTLEPNKAQRLVSKYAKPDSIAMAQLCVSQLRDAGVRAITGDPAKDKPIIEEAERVYTAFIRERCRLVLTRWTKTLKEHSDAGMAEPPETDEVKWAKAKVAARKL